MREEREGGREGRSTPHPTKHVIDLRGCVGSKGLHFKTEVSGH